jgi:hypothetical protein
MREIICPIFFTFITTILLLMFVDQAGAGYQEDVLADSPLLYLRFEESDMSHGQVAADLGSMGRGGTYVANNTTSMYPVVGAPGTGQGAYMPQQTTSSGAGNCIDIWDGDLVFSLPDVTYEAWVMIEPGSLSYSRIFQHNGDWLNEGGPGVIAAAGTDKGVWHHVVVTYESGDSVLEQLYINGVLQGTATGPNDLRYTFERITIGAEGNRWWLYNHMKGAIDEFAIYDSILSPYRISEHYLSGRAAYLPFDCVYGIIGGDSTEYIPEPVTVLLVGLGGLMIRRLKFKT